ncbi:MAG: hypothetical protein LBE39_07780 [Flavobacteriaceae bacterium]|nr:hypothetical protein [Flavobacteriaceae bacterium]
MRCSIRSFIFIDYNYENSERSGGTLSLSGEVKFKNFRLPILKDMKKFN